MLELDSDTNAKMADFMRITEGLFCSHEPEIPEEPLNESFVVTDKTSSLINDLEDLIVKMRSFMESDSGEYALGVETGMQRAADMIENAIRRNRGNDD